MSSELQKKREREAEQQKLKRRRDVVKAALTLFNEKGIEASSIQEIADRAEIGVASVYRYFSNKGELAVEAAILNWQNGYTPLTEAASKSPTGAEKLKTILDGFLQLFRENPDFFRYLEDFDNFISRLPKRPEAMARYEQVLAENDRVEDGVLEEGIADGSLKDLPNLHALFSISGLAVTALAQKLLNRGHITSRDEQFDPEVQLRMLIETLLDNILVDKDGK